MKKLLALLMLQVIIAIYFWAKVLFAPYEDIVAELIVVLDLVGILINSIAIMKS